MFRPAGMTPVPLSSGEIAGVLNLRGRIVTAIDARVRLGLTSPGPGKGRGLWPSASSAAARASGSIIDEIGEVVRIDESAMEQNPVNLDATWSWRIAGRLPPRGPASGHHGHRPDAGGRGRRRTLLRRLG